jgi:hypothetical protein
MQSTTAVRDRTHIFLGLAVILWGGLMLLDNLGFLDARGVFRLYWPGLIAAWGVGLMLYGHPNQRVVGAGMALFGGLLLFGRTINVSVWRLFWPLILIYIGVRMIAGGGPPWRTGRRRSRSMYWPIGSEKGEDATTASATAASHESTDGDTMSTLQEFAFLGGVERRNTSQTFRGGEATAVLGGVEIDLRESRMAEEDARLTVFAFMGGISLRIPRDWTVESQVSAILGGFQDMSAPPVGVPARRFIISGQAVLGGIEIKN